MSGVFDSGGTSAKVADLLLQIVQLELFRRGFKKYRRTLGRIADASEVRAMESYKAFETLRARDVEFFEYYCNLPQYEECMANVARNKGVAWAKYGSDLRRVNRATRGYTPLSRVGTAQYLGQQPVNEMAIRRVHALTAERRRVDEHRLNRWDAILGSPVYNATHISVASAISSSFTSLKTSAAGANSALLGLGSSIGNFGQPQEPTRPGGLNGN